MSQWVTRLRRLMMRKSWYKTWNDGATPEIEAVREINSLPFAEPIEPRFGEPVGWPSAAEMEAFGPHGYIKPREKK